MRTLLSLAAFGALMACQAAPPSGDTFDAPIAAITVPRDGAVEVSRGFGPPDADPNRCYGHEIDPAIIETVTEQVLLEPEELDRDGNVRRPAVFITQTQQRIVEGREEIWFETPCAVESDPAYIASLQRALAARGLYVGPVTGQLDPATVAAVRAYQVPQGLDSGVLSLAAARRLGLSIWDPELAAGGRGLDAE